MDYQQHQEAEDLAKGILKAAWEKVHGTGRPFPQPTGGGRSQYFYRDKLSEILESRKKR